MPRCSHRLSWHDDRYLRYIRLDPKLRARLALTYRDDLTELEALTGRDLSHWRT